MNGLRSIKSANAQLSDDVRSSFDIMREETADCLNEFAAMVGELERHRALAQEKYQEEEQNMYTLYSIGAGIPWGRWDLLLHIHGQKYCAVNCLSLFCLSCWIRPAIAR